ncbi:MAG: hypothetical protein ACI9LO_001456 [Planctomycetota bacterium]|jgi:hypothetical protein
MLRKAIGLMIILAAIIQSLSILADFWRYPDSLETLLSANWALLLLIVIELILVKNLPADRKMGFGKGLSVALIAFIGSLTSAYLATVIYVDYRLPGRDYSDVYQSCFKVWAARGLVTEGPDITPGGTQNSIESIALAFAEGASGTEVDVFFDTDRGEFIVSHNYPYLLKNGEILTLEQLFEATGEQAYFWIDFKKIRHLDDEQLRQSVAELTRISNSGTLKSRIYVEGEAPFSLAAYRDAGFQTIFDTHPEAQSSPFSSFMLNVYKSAFYFGDYSVMGMNYGRIDDPIYGERAGQLLAGIPVFVYHVDDDAETLENLSKMDSVRVILVENHSLNRYRLNGCAGNE